MVAGRLICFCFPWTKMVMNSFRRLFRAFFSAAVSVRLRFPTADSRYGFTERLNSSNVIPIPASRSNSASRRSASATDGSFRVVGSMDEAFADADAVYPKSWGPRELMLERVDARLGVATCDGDARGPGRASFRTLAFGRHLSLVAVSVLRLRSDHRRLCHVSLRILLAAGQLTRASACLHRPARQVAHPRIRSQTPQPKRKRSPSRRLLDDAALCSASFVQSGTGAQVWRPGSRWGLALDSSNASSASRGGATRSRSGRTWWTTTASRRGTRA